jgi:hypothetical protein
MTSAQRYDRSTMKEKLTGFVRFWSGRLEDWDETGETGIEKKYAQSFWTDFLSCFGINASRQNLFEQEARRSKTGGRGYIDLFWPSVVIGEAKSPGIDLETAYRQTLEYLHGGDVKAFEQPRFIICTNFDQFRLMRLGEPEVRFDITFPLAEVTDHLDELKFLAGYEEITAREEEKASLAAAKLMADLFVAIVGDDVDEETGDEAPTDKEDEDELLQEASMFLTRLLFLLFGDDTGLWEHDLFYRFVKDDTNPETIGSQLNTLFQVLDTPEDKRRRVPDSMKKFPYVNGSIFEGVAPAQFFNPQMHEALLDACRFRWADISPAIFGSLFQLVKSKEARRSDGEHYTSEKNILKTLRPLFLDELRKKANDLLTSPSDNGKELEAFKQYLASLVFCDPACGSGNFLIIAYRELRKIETDIIEAQLKKGEERLKLEKITSTFDFDVSFYQKLSINQFHGIELNWWPARIAETAMFLVDHAANQELAARVGVAPERLPIKITAHIHHGNALQLDWRELLPKEKVSKTYVFGNPPFIGQYTKTKEQTADMQHVWGKDYDGYLDYVTGWHAQAMRLLHDRLGEFAYVTTNSITQGQPVPALFEPLEREGWRIKFAHRTFKWDSEAPGKAAVHCVIVGFTKNRKAKQHLWDYPDVQGEPVEIEGVKQITPYLVDGPYVLVKKRNKKLSPVLPNVLYGSKPADGGFLVPKAGTPRPEHDPVAMKYVRPFNGAQELLHNVDRWCYWLVDLDPADEKKSSTLREALRGVKAFRLASKKEATQKAADTAKLFTEIRQPHSDYVCIPRHVSETRKYFTVAHFSPEVISGDANFVASDPDGFLFGLISSSMFITWQRTVGGRIKSDLRFANTLTWNTFPLPDVDEKTRQKIIDAGKKVIAARALHPDWSLADHYNPLTMEPKLLKAHDALDREVDKAMGAPRKLTTMRQRQELLLNNYVRLTSTL